MTFNTTAKAVGLTLGALVSAWTLFGKMDDSLIRHLDSVFATKQDMQQMEQRLMDRLDILQRRK